MFFSSTMKKGLFLGFLFFFTLSQWGRGPTPHWYNDRLYELWKLTVWTVWTDFMNCENWPYELWKLTVWTVKTDLMNCENWPYELYEITLWTDLMNCENWPYELYEMTLWTERMTCVNSHCLADWTPEERPVHSFFGISSRERWKRHSGNVPRPVSHASQWETSLR